ncbi:MAG TPA: MBL fold metallo-hydrolase [Bryobacteraceae bacterium]|nr:MBL fold metallo-hydrolase [Bryobacteraceae bacterium]HPQ14950.1 MBL fold metallo-hydrolase [Bryobacteraceae bacterium]HPU72099.1 MBL fold metallo-hydrolase [Bryobacteraceae bacterium]
MQLTCWGAVQTVTGSMHELRVNGARILLDCGLYQGHRREARERNANLPFRAADIDAAILSHAHIDHSGNLPTLVKNGFAGPIYATPATADLCVPMLTDCAYIQEKDAEFVNKRYHRRKRLDPEARDGAVPPLYSMEDAEATMPHFSPVPVCEEREIAPRVTYRAFEAGHMLGSSAVVITDHSNGKPVRLAFSGDVGRPGLPIIRDPEPLPPVDYLIIESTYGGRLHKATGIVSNKLANVINRTCERGGKIIVPAFAVGRTQQLVLMLHELFKQERIPRIPIFVDSPLAVTVTEVFRKHAELYDEETRQFLLQGDDPFGFARLRYITDVAESKALNDLRGPMMIISASGMCEAGRILHHLRNNIENPRNTILITGFQAENTLGRKLVDKLPEVAIFGEPMRLRAEVETLNELSGHADQSELLSWMKPLVPGLRRVFVVHGEPVQSAALKQAIEERYCLEVVIPTRGAKYELN